MTLSITSTLVSGLLAALPAALPASAAPAADGPLVIRVGKAETISHGTLEHAVILVEDGKISVVGEDLPVERGLRVLERPDWVVTPGFVNCYSRLGMDSRAGSGFEPQIMASGELFALQEVYADVLETGTTTLGLYAAGSGGVPGQAVAIRPKGDTAEQMILEDGVYLKVFLASNAKSKKTLRDAFGKIADHEEKVEKAREKWAKKNKKKKDKDKDPFVGPDPDPKVKVFMDLREKKLAAMMRIRKASDFLHLVDVIEDEEIDWHLRVPLRTDIDLYEVKDQIGERELLVVVDPRVTLMPNTRRVRNIPAELARAGARVALIPSRDSITGHEAWREDVGQLIRDGLDRQVALAAMTLHPAQALGLGERLGSIAAERDANLLFWSGDPFEPATELMAVMLEGEFVYEEVER